MQIFVPEGFSSHGYSVIDRSAQSREMQLTSGTGAELHGGGRGLLRVRLPSEGCLTPSGDKKSQSRVKAAEEPFRGTQRLAAPTSEQ